MSLSTRAPPRPNVEAIRWRTRQSSWSSSMSRGTNCTVFGGGGTATDAIKGPGHGAAELEAPVVKL
eukprot:308635-Lingulodinium_polyedra.AAC.1